MSILASMADEVESPPVKKAALDVVDDVKKVEDALASREGFSSENFKVGLYIRRYYVPTNDDFFPYACRSRSETCPSS